MSGDDGHHVGANGHVAGAVVAATSPRDAAGASEPETTPLVVGALWRRVLARFIDWFAMFWLLFAFQVIGLTFWVRDYGDDIAPWLWGEWFLVITTIAMLYGLVEVIYLAKRGQSPAKELLKIRVAHPEREGGGLGWRLALLRWVVPGVVMALPIVVSPFVLAALGAPALFDPQRRTLYDRLAGTTVVPYDARAVEGPIKSRRTLIRNAMDRQIAAIAGRPELLEGREDHTAER